MAREPSLQGPGRFRHQGARLQTDGGSVSRTGLNRLSPSTQVRCQVYVSACNFSL